MGVACGRTWHRGSGGLLEAKVWLCWWLGHMLLNVAWAPVFFGLKRLRIALAINYGMVLSLCGILIPRAVDRTTALLLVPYALWLLYATALNQAICQRNPVYFARGSAYNNAMFQADLIALQKAAAQYAAGISKGPK